ncbi:hypothetical protein H8959_004070 [Pygathrix nigripes]
MNYLGKSYRDCTLTLRLEQSMDMGTSALSKKPWWTLPENFHAPMVFHMEEDQEERIFGHGDTYLRCIEVHSHTLIQLESWFTATGQTRVTVVGPHRARQWLLHMFCCVGSQDSYHHARGLEMLEHVRSQPLTNDDLVTSISVPPYTGDLSLAPRISGTICLSVPQPSPYQDELTHPRIFLDLQVQTNGENGKVLYDKTLITYSSFSLLGKWNIAELNQNERKRILSVYFTPLLSSEKRQSSPTGERKPGGEERRRENMRERERCDGVLDWMTEGS